MSALYDIGQRVKIILGSDTVSNSKYPQLAKYAGETGVIEESTSASELSVQAPTAKSENLYVVRLDKDKSTIGAPESVLEAVA